MLIALLLAVLAAPLADDPAIAHNPAAPAPALHLGSYGSMRAAKLLPDGTIDSGAGWLQLLNAETGKPLVPDGLRYGVALQDWATFTAPCGELAVEVKALAMPVDRAGDERVKATVRVIIANRGAKAARVPLGASLRPGGGDPDDRPYPCLAFDPGSIWAQDGSYITRDGRAVLGWAGTDANVTLTDHAVAPGDEIARLKWSLEIPAGQARLMELSIFGPPATDTVNEPAFREGSERWTYQAEEEQLAWQTNFRGDFADIQLHDPRLWFAIVGPIEYLRTLGVADKDPQMFSDRPFGHPASDAAFDYEVIGVIAEWGFTAWDADFLKLLVDKAVERGRDLPPARRVALVHGLARAIRVGQDPELHVALAAAIETLLDKSTEGAEVQPWLDPGQVREDLQAVLDAAPPAEGWTLPHFKPATVAAGSVAEQFQLIRDALVRHDADAVWQHIAPLVANSSLDGLGAMRPGATPDGNYQVGIASLFRDMIVDDHGPDLHLFPGIPRQMIPSTGHGDLYLPNLPTRYGNVEMRQFFVARKSFGVQVIRHSEVAGARTLIHIPPGLQPETLISPVGGSVQLQDDGLILCDFDLTAPKGLRFNVKLAKGAPDAPATEPDKSTDGH